MKKHHRSNQESIPQATSRLIDLLRFPLIVGVVFIHGVFYGEFLPEPGGESTLPVYHFTVNLLSRLVPQICVPLFFLFSGYLFYFGVDSFTTGVYLSKLKRRVKTLLVPYLFWNTVLVVAILLLDGHFGLAADRMAPFPLSLWANERFDNGFVSVPVASQFWFIRDLMVCVVLSPLIYFVVFRTRHFGVLLLGAGWLLGLKIPFAWEYGMSTAALFFFSLGGWLSHYRSNLAVLADDVRILGLAWPVLIALQWTDTGGVADTILWNLMILTGIVFAISLASWLVTRRRVHAVPFLTAASFFVFAWHMQWGQSPLRRLLFALFHPETDAAMTAVYLAHIVLTIVIGVVVFRVLNLLSPRLMAIVTGGRVHEGGK